jgi:hypothetical protein
MKCIDCFYYPRNIYFHLSEIVPGSNTIIIRRINQCSISLETISDALEEHTCNNFSSRKDSLDLVLDQEEIYGDFLEKLKELGYKEG